MSKSVLKEENVIRHALDQEGGDAFKHALSEGVVVTILQDDIIQRVYPNGKKVDVRKMAKSDKRVLAKRIRLK